MNLPNTHWTAIQAAQAGSTGALEALVERYRPAVVAFMARRGPSSEAEDLTQEVFLRLFTQDVLERATREKGRFRGLLFGVARNVLGHHYERAGAQKRSAHLVPLEEGRLSAEAEEFERAWVRNLVRRGLDGLEQDRPHYHEAIRLTVFEERSQAEAAELLGCSVSDIKNHVKRGKKKLAERVKSEIRDYCRDAAEYEEELSLLERWIP
jgi:RNA polymerase sigma-70 factor (ECF subfamily)